MPRRNVHILIIVIIFSLLCSQQSSQDPYGRYLEQTINLVHHQGLDKFEKQELLEGAMTGIANMLDTNSSYLKPINKDELKNLLKQRFTGIGIRLEMRGLKKDQLRVAAPPIQNSPAQKAGLKRGDHILAIDGTSIKGKTIAESMELLKGKAETPVQLTISRPGTKDNLTVDLIRNHIPLQYVLGIRSDDHGNQIYLLKNHPEIAYINIQKFGDKTFSEIAQVIKDVEKQGAKRLIIDLRNNTGGSLPAAVNICDLFLPANKLVVGTYVRGDRLEKEYSTQNPEICTLPLAILINDKSASASEIMAGCLQDYKRAIIVGQRSYGKGSVQNVFSIEGGRSDFKLTTAIYKRPSGVNIHCMEKTIRGQAKDFKPDEKKAWGVKPNSEGLIALDPESNYELTTARIVYQSFGIPYELQLSDEEKLLPPDPDQHSEEAIKARFHQLLKQPLNGLDDPFINRAIELLKKK